MYWLAVSLVVDSRAVNALSDALLDNGALSVDVGDAAAGTAWEKPIFDELGGAPAADWERAKVCALFASTVNIEEKVRAACSAAQVPPQTAYEVHRVDDQDWVRATQAQFAPQRITSRLWIVPSWHTAPDTSAINIRLDPGLAFGTGSHPTTRLCLRWLEAHIQGGESLIDFGCGSGILAIAALKLGAGRATGVDIDPLAVSAARSNAVRNEVRATFVSAVDRLHDPADIVVANILANPLIVLAPLLSRLTVRGGRIALSGILAEQTDEVAVAYAQDFALEQPVADEGWILLTGTRR
ncbi:MAG TPA: 50S ribosomal protein L11 methyltransferase [Burkholderiales bacterium]|nr:50S ribosomal protein L11 methyltransferase [Burkholderiales bacterium]